MKISTSPPSVLASLRALTPRRRLNLAEALQIAELQATRLYQLIADERGILEHHLTGLPRISVIYEDIAVSGMSHWNGREWIITLCASDSRARQRFTLLHEFKHIIDHAQTDWLYVGDRRHTPQEQAEAAADYFAGCALVGRRELKSAWGNRIQRIEDLAAHFGVSVQAVQVRLAQTGLDVIADRIPTRRCARPISTPRGRVQRFRTVGRSHRQRSYA